MNEPELNPEKKPVIAENPRDLQQVMYIVINNDLKMGKGKIGAQCAHAACLAVQFMERVTPTPKFYKDWENNGVPKIVLKASEEEMNILQKTYSSDEMDDYWCVHIRDAGKTQIKANSLTTLAFRPTMRKLVPPALKILKLL